MTAMAISGKNMPFFMAKEGHKHDARSLIFYRLISGLFIMQSWFLKK